VDASHPFAEVLHRELADVCTDLGIRRIRYERPETDPGPGVEVVETHQAAAASAVGHGTPILLTTGSRNLLPYVDAARSAQVPLFARVLPGAESERASRLAGFPEARIEFARGPFSVEQTRSLIRRWRIGVLVAKNGGIASGIAERLEAARREGVIAVLVRRPERESGAAGSFKEILEGIGGPGPSPLNRAFPLASPFAEPPATVHADDTMGRADGYADAR
jgi:precorrin-6A/cobalt-precorrin-6A reductase